MWFNSFLFLFFLALVLPAYYATAGWRRKKALLLFCSYLFYACWNPPFLLLLLVSSTIDYFVGRRLGKETRPGARRLLVVISCSTNLGILAFFKYSKFLLDNFDAAVRFLHAPWLSIGPPEWLNTILLPVGISFYTFHGMSYIIDVYKGRKTPVDDWIDFYLFVSFFPQLVAGPILRATQFMPQLVTPRRVGLHDWEVGIYRIVLGLFQKVFMADNIAPLVNYVFDRPLAFNSMQQWMGVYAFAMQIYFDFAGYSNIAIGVARLLGFQIPDNFNLPYLAIGFRDFWRRWHISLSTWLRDYLFIPLGGSRAGTLFTYRNLLITMFLGGLWHGATWSFAVWGLLHGFYLVVEHRTAGFWARVPRAIAENRLVQCVGILFTFHLTCIAWVFFRLSTSITDALKMCAGMFSFNGASIGAAGFERLDYAYLGFAGYVAVWMYERLKRTFVMPAWASAASAAAMLYLVIVGWGNASEFIYFQF